jgi:ribosome-associated protein
MAKNKFNNKEDSHLSDHELPEGLLQNGEPQAGELLDDEGAEYFEEYPPRTGAFRLEQYMKAFNIAASGGQAKVLIQSGQVRVNGKVETRRKRQLQAGDKIQFLGETWLVAGG